MLGGILHIEHWMTSAMFNKSCFFTLSSAVCLFLERDHLGFRTSETSSILSSSSNSSVGAKSCIILTSSLSESSSFITKSLLRLLRYFSAILSSLKPVLQNGVEFIQSSSNSVGCQTLKRTKVRKGKRIQKIVLFSF